MNLQLGSIPLSDEYLAEETVGHWVIENDPGKEPRMYVDDVMLGLIGLEAQTNPEDTFRAWYEGIDVNYMDSVMETERLNINGIHAEVQYPWHYKDGRTILIRCEGMRNFAYKGGTRTEGRHRNITELLHIQKEAAVISALSDDFDCVDYVLLHEDKSQDMVIPFRTSERIRNLIPGWDHELNFHNRLELLLNAVGYQDDLQEFYTQTRREVVLRHLENAPAYFVNARAVVQGCIEYYQLKFTGDKDRDGNLIGIIVGIHNVDDEMRREIELREKIARVVDKKTEELKNKNEALSKINDHIIEMIGNIVESRDEECGNHISRVKNLTQILAMQVMRDLPEYQLTVEDVSAITRMSPLHDVGKIRIPDNILFKPGRFTKEEYEVMKSHCDKGCEILEGMGDVWDPKLVKLSLDICRYHHEKWDGNGYPCGLKGDEIPIAAQIVSIADIYDALVSERCYKSAYSHEKAYEMILGGECGAFSEKLLSCLRKCKDAFKDSAVYAEVIGEETSLKSINAIVSGEYISGAVPFLEKISESMPGGFFIYQADEDQKFIYFNDIMVDYLGCSSREEFIEYTNNSFKGLVHPEDFEYINGDIFTQIKKDNLDHIVYRVIRKDGEIRWLDDYGRFIHSEDMGDMFFVFVIDFTEIYQRREARYPESGHSELKDTESDRGILNKMKIMIVDDSELARELHRDLLEEEGAEVVEASSGVDAVNLIRESMDYDLILMDLVMPVMSGVSAIREINRLLDEAGRHITIICVTAEGSDMQVKEAMEAGAYECLYKPLNIPELSRRVFDSIKENTIRLEQQLEEAKKIGNTDALTKVKNIVAFTDKTADLAARLKENVDYCFGVVVCDCDKLKYVNDSFGHDIGNAYIRNTSSMICETFKHSPVYRIGGDEFAVILLGPDYRNAETLFGKLKDKAATDCTLDSIQSGAASFSSGLAMLDRSVDETVGDVIKRADAAMYHDKKAKQFASRMS